MAVAVNPIDEIRVQLQEAVSGPGLAPAERLAQLRTLRAQVKTLLGEADTYIGDVELLREADYITSALSLMRVRENASLREELIKRGMATPEELDAAGYFSNEALNQLREEGRLVDSADQILSFVAEQEGRMQEAFGFSGKLGQVVGDLIHFDPKLHPRGRGGKFVEVLDKLASGGTSRTPTGVEVKKHHRGGYSVHHPDGRSTVHTDAKDAAANALHGHDDIEDGIRREEAAKAAKARPKPTMPPHLPPKGRRGRQPSVLHQPAPGSGGMEPGVGEETPVGAQHPGERGTRTEGGPPWEAVVEGVRSPASLHGDPAELDMDSPPSDEEVQATLARARELGVDDWPEKGEVAKRIYGPEARGEPGFIMDNEALYSDKNPKYDPDDPDSYERIYSPERQKLHKEIIKVLMRERKEIPHPTKPGETITVLCSECPMLKPPADGKPVVLFMAGGTASGKSTALKAAGNEDVTPPGAVHIDPDEIKGMFPEYADMVEAGDKYAASGVHEESSHLAKQLQREAMVLGLNAVVDGTGDSQITEKDKKGKFAKKVTTFTDAGYEAQMFYVNVEADQAVIRGVQRAMKSGRWVPEKEVRKIHKGVSERFRGEIMDLVNDGTVTKMKGYDTSGGGADLMFHLDDEGKFVVVDKALHDSFTGKADAPDWQPPGVETAPETAPAAAPAAAPEGVSILAEREKDTRKEKRALRKELGRAANQRARAMREAEEPPDEPPT